MEKRILTIIAVNLITVRSSCADAFEPVANVRIKLVIDDSCKGQQDHDVDGKVCEVRVFFTFKIYEADVQVAVEYIAVIVKSKFVVFAEEAVIV